MTSCTATRRAAAAAPTGTPDVPWDSRTRRLKLCRKSWWRLHQRTQRPAPAQRQPQPSGHTPRQRWTVHETLRSPSRTRACWRVHAERPGKQRQGQVKSSFFEIAQGTRDTDAHCTGSRVSASRDQPRDLQLNFMAQAGSGPGVHRRPQCGSKRLSTATAAGVLFLNA